MGLSKSKGTSLEKSDINLSFIENGFLYENQGTSIKSFLGSAPTLLNASQATNFIFKITNLKKSCIDEINNIETSSKIKDRISSIEQNGGCFTFKECENKTYERTLRKVDSCMPEILAEALISFFKNKITNKLKDYPEKRIIDEAKSAQIECRLKDFVKATILGIFPNQEWNGNLTANSVLLVNQNGEIIFYHTNQDKVLKDFFYNYTFFDTPSSTRHRFGTIYQENGELLFKLNLQLRLGR